MCILFKFFFNLQLNFNSQDDELNAIRANIDLNQFKSTTQPDLNFNFLVEILIKDVTFKSLHDNIVDLNDVSLKLKSMFLSQRDCDASIDLNAGEKSSDQFPVSKKPMLRPLLKAPNPYINDFFNTDPSKKKYFNNLKLIIRV